MRAVCLALLALISLATAAPITLHPDVQTSIPLTNNVHRLYDDDLIYVLKPSPGKVSINRFNIAQNKTLWSTELVRCIRVTSFTLTPPSRSMMRT